MRVTIATGRWIIAATAALTLLAAVGTAQAKSAPGLTLTGQKVEGYVNLTVTGPAGQTIALSEQHAGGRTPLASLVLPPSGHAVVRHAVQWQCAPLTRTLVASETSGASATSGLATAAEATATLTVDTPACTNRLAVQLPREATVDRYRMVAVRDRWGIGALPLTVCEEPPGGTTACHSQTLAPGQPRGAVRLDLPRPGGYEVTVSGHDGIHHRQLVWVRHPDGELKLLAAGDSEMQILDGDLAADLTPYHVRVTEDARPSTGLTVPGDLNWEREARRQARHLHPDVTIVSMGANEGYAIPGTSGGLVNCCGAAWTAGYGQLVFQMANTLLQDHLGRVYWLLLATPKPPNFQRVFDSVNTGASQAAARLPGRMGLIDANSFFTPDNVYRDQMTYDGQSFTIHEPDGIHLDADADGIAARLIVARLLADRVIRPLG